MLAPGLQPPAVKWTGFAKYNFIGGHNDADHVPVDELIEAATDVLTREGGRSRPTGLPAARSATGRCAIFSRRNSSAPPAIGCAADEILITSGSLQALDLVNGILLSPGDTVIIERDSIRAR